MARRARPAASAGRIIYILRGRSRKKLGVQRERAAASGRPRLLFSFSIMIYGYMTIALSRLLAMPSRLRLQPVPRIDDRGMCLVEIASITRNNRKSVMNGSCGDNQIWLRESMAALPAFLDQESPLEHDVFGDLENPMVEHRADFVCEPVIQLGAAIGFVNKLNAEANLCKSYRADVKLIQRATGHKIYDSRLWLWAAQF